MNNLKIDNIEYYTVTQVSKMLKVGRAAVHHMIKRGALIPIKIGSQYLISCEELNRLKESRQK